MTPGFEKYCLGDLCSFVSGGTPNKRIAAYWQGSTPWVSAKDLKSLRITSSIDTLSDKGRAVASLLPADSLLILVRGMSLFKTVPIAIAMNEVAINQDIKGLVPNEKVSSLFLAYSLLAREDMLLQMVEAAGHGTGRLDTDALKSLVVRIPRRDEQHRIVSLLTTWDNAIDATKRLIAAKERLRRHIRELLMSSNRAPQVKLRSLTRECITRNGQRLSRSAIMAVTKEQGMRPMREETISAYIDRYKVVSARAFAYNPMRLNIGSIAVSSFDGQVLVSPDYVVFECDESKLLSAYLNHLRFTRHWSSYFGSAGNGSVRVRIYYDDLASFAFPLPAIKEQYKIVEQLDTAVQELEILRRYALALERQKRGLMQKLLTGEWRVPLPEPEVA